MTAIDLKINYRDDEAMNDEAVPDTDLAGILVPSRVRLPRQIARIWASTSLCRLAIKSCNLDSSCHALSCHLRSACCCERNESTPSANSRKRAQNFSPTMYS